MNIKIFVNGVATSKEKKKFPIDYGDIIIKAKKGYMYANPFILQPVQVSPRHESIPKFIYSEITRLIKSKNKKTDKYLIIFNKQELPNTQKSPSQALIDKYMLTNGKVQARWINKTELVVDLSHEEDYKALQITTGASPYPFINKYSKNLQLSKFIQSTQAKILSNFPQEFTTFIPSLSENSSSDCASLLTEIGDLFVQMIQKQSSNLSSDLPIDPQVQFFPISDKRLPSVIVRKGNKMKSIPLNEDGTYDLEGLHFGDPPKYIDDEITIHLPIKDIFSIIQSLKNAFWQAIDSKNILGALLIPFLKQFCSFLKTGKVMQKSVYVPCVYKDALLFFQTFIVLIQKELQSVSSSQSFLFSDLEKDQEMLKTVIELPFYGQPLPAQEAKQVQKEEVKQEVKDAQDQNVITPPPTINYSYYQLLELLCAASKFQDQLYALSQSSEASSQLCQLWNSSIRIHTAFGRLSSFTSASENFYNDYTRESFGISNHSAYKMADAGLLAVRNEHSTSYRLWTSSTAFIPTSDISKFKSIPELLRNNYPHTYDNIISHFNIPLSHTIKYLPAVKFAQQNVSFIKPAGKQIPYLLVGYTDQTIAIINGKIRPFSIMTISFKTGKSGSTIQQKALAQNNNKKGFGIQILQSSKSKKMRQVNEEKLQVSPSTKEAQQIIKAYTVDSNVDNSKPKQAVKFKELSFDGADYAFLSMDQGQDDDDDDDDQDEQEDCALVNDIFSQQEDEPKDTATAAFQPNNEILMSMLAMGFEKTLSIQALKKCQNKSLEVAIDSVIQIQSKIDAKIKQLSMPQKSSDAKTEAKDAQDQKKMKEDEEQAEELKEEENKQPEEPQQVKQKRQILRKVYETGQILDINLVEINKFTSTNVRKYRVEVIIYSQSIGQIIVFSSELIYSLSVVETIGHLHKGESFHLIPLSSLNGPEDKMVQRFDLRSILPLYSQAVETLVPIFTKRRTAFELDSMCSDINNFHIFQDVRSISNIRYYDSSQGLSIICGKERKAFLKVGKAKLLQAQLSGDASVNWEEVQMLQRLQKNDEKQELNCNYLAKYRDKNQLIVLKQTAGNDNKLTISPASEPFQLDFDSKLSGVSLWDNNRVVIQSPQLHRQYSLTKTEQLIFQIKPIQPQKPLQALQPSADSISCFLQRGFYSLCQETVNQNQICEKVELSALKSLLTQPSKSSQALLQQSLIFKNPIPVLTSLDITCTFTQNQEASLDQITKSCSVEKTSMSGPDYRYMNQILNHYSPVTSSSISMTDHPLSLKLVSKNESNSQANIGCVLTYPKILHDPSNTDILQTNPYLQENDSDFLFQQVDGKQILVSMIKFELMFQWGQVAMLLYTGDSIQQMYADDCKANSEQTASPQKKIEQYESFLNNAKISGKELSQSDPVALIKVNKNEVSPYQASLGNKSEKRFDVQFKRPARYLRIKILDKLTKKSERYLINCFQAYGSEVEEMYLNRTPQSRSKFNEKRWIDSGYEAKIQLTLKHQSEQGGNACISYKQVDVVKRTGMKQERNQIKITEILSPEKKSNIQIDALSQLKSLDQEHQRKLGRITTLSYLSIPITQGCENVIGVKVKLFKRNLENQGQQQKNNWIPSRINIRAYQQTYPILHKYRYELINFNQFDKLVELAQTSQKGVNLMLKLLQLRPDFIDKFQASFQLEQVISNVLFAQSYDTVDIYSILRLISTVTDSETMQEQFKNLGKSYLKLQRFITQQMTRSGVYFFLSLCKYHFNQATNIEFLQIFHSLNSLIFTKFSKMNPEAINAFNEVARYSPVKIPKLNFEYQILKNKDIELYNCDKSELYQKPVKAISVKFQSNVGYYVSEIVVEFFKSQDASSSHFPDWCYVSAMINIDPKTEGYRKINARLTHILGICNCYSIKFSEALFVRDQIVIQHITHPVEPIINLGSFKVTVFGISLSSQQPQFIHQRYRLQIPPLPTAILTQPQQEALESLPYKPKTIASLLKLLMQSKAIAEFIAQNIITSIQSSNIELSSKQAEKCFSLWMHLPDEFPWEKILNKIQYMSKVIFTKVPPYDAAYVSIQQLRQCLIGGKMFISHTALLKFIQSLGFPSNFIYAYLQRYFGGTASNTAFIFNSSQFNTSKFKSERSNNFIFLYILAQLGQSLPYTTGDAQTLFKNQGKIKLSSYTDITLPTKRAQKNKIISNVLRGLLQNSDMYTLQQLVAILRVLLLSLVMGMKAEVTDAAKYQYGDVGKRQSSLMVKLLSITLESRDPELKILMANLANLTKTNSSIIQHVDAPLIMLNKLIKQLPKETLQQGKDLTVSEWIARFKYLIQMTSWKSNVKMKDFIFSLCLQILPPQHNSINSISNNNNNSYMILCQSYQFWQLLTDLIFRLRSNISSKHKQAINFCQNFILYASESNKTEFYKVAMIVSSILSDSTRDQTSQKSKMAKNIFRAVFNMFDRVRTQNQWNSILGFIRQILQGITINLNEERAFLLHIVVTHILNKIHKWSLDDPSCANLVSSQYVQLAYQIMSKIFFQKDSQACAQIFATVLAESELDQIAKGMVKWFFLTEEIFPGKECHNQEHSIRFITDGLYKMFISLCETSSFRRKAMFAIIEIVTTIDECVFDEEFAIKPAVEISDQCNSIFGGLLRLTITTKKQCELFLNTFNGVEFLENRLQRVNTGNIVYDMTKSYRVKRDMQGQEDSKLLKKPLNKLPENKSSSALISTVPSTTSINSNLSIPSTPSSSTSKAKKPIKAVPLSVSKYKMSAKKATDSRKQSSGRHSTSLSTSISNNNTNSNNSNLNLLPAQPSTSLSYNRNAHQIVCSFPVSTKSQSIDSDLFTYSKGVSIVRSSQYWNLTNTQLGDSCDLQKMFSPSDIKIQNYSNKKLSKIEQKSIAKFNKDFNWSIDGIKDGGSNINLSVGYLSQQSISFQVNQTIEMKDITIAFNNILSSNSSNRPIPTSITMNYGLTQDMRNSVRLQRIHDPHFGMSAVYGINMHTIPNSCISVRRAMQSFKRLKVRFINFQFEKGYYFGMRGNINQKYLTQNNSEILKFIEINGYPVTTIGNYLSYIGMQRRLSTLKFMSELLKDRSKLQTELLLRDTIAGLDQELMKQYLSIDTKSAMQILQIIISQVKDQESLDNILAVVRRFIEKQLSAGKNTVSQMMEVKKLFLRLVFNYGVKNLDDEVSTGIQKFRSNSSNFSQSIKIIRQLHGWIEAIKIQIEKDNINIAKYLSDLVNTVLLIATKEHLASQEEIIGMPLIIDRYPKKEDLIMLARAAIRNPQHPEFINLLSLYLNPPLGIVFTGFKIDQLYSDCSNQEILNLIQSIISSSNNEVALNQFKKLEKQLLTQALNIIHNPEKESDHILFTKILQWSQRYSIRKSLVERNFGIELFVNVKSNFAQIKSKVSLVEKLVNCIKKLVYGFPQVEDELAKIILQDDKVFDLQNQDFNSSVLFPLLFGEQTLNIALNPFISVGDQRVWLNFPDSLKNATQMGPLGIKLLSTYAQQLVAVSGFPIKSTIFSPQQKRVFSNFFVNTLTPGQLLLIQFAKFTSQGNLSPNNYSNGCNMLSFGTGYNKSTKTNYVVGFFSMSSVESVMKIKGDSSQHTYFFIYSEGANKKQYHHFRLKPKFSIPGRKSCTSLFQLDNKNFYFPSKDKYIFKLDQNKSHGSSSPQGMVFCPQKPSFKDQNFISLDSSQKFAQLVWPFSVKQTADDMPPIFMKVISGQVQSFLNNLNVHQMIKNYEFCHPFFQNAKMEKYEFSHLSEEEIKRNPWHDKNNDFVSRLNPKWRIPQGATLKYIIQQLLNMKMISDIKIQVYKNGQRVDLSQKLSQLIISHNETANEKDNEDKEEEKKFQSQEIDQKLLIDGQRRKIISQSQTMEFDIDLTNLLELYCANRVASNSSALGSASTTTNLITTDPKKLAPKKKKSVLIGKKIKKTASDLSIPQKKQQSKEASKQQQEQQVVVEDYEPQLGLFKSFSRQAGFNKIVQLLRSKISTSNSTTDNINQLTEWLQQIEDFSNFPNYQQQLLKNKECRDFFLEDVIRSDNIAQKFLDRKEEIRNVPFQTLSALFSLDPDPQLRKTALDKNIIKNVLRNIQALTNEVSRKYDQTFDRDQEEKKILQKQKEAEREREKRRKQEEQIKNIDKKKRKGVGYVTNQGTVWNIQKYMKDRQARNQRVRSFIDFIASLFDSENWQPNQENSKPLLESCLLPLIESSFTAGSLVNLVKDFPLVMAVFNLVTVFGRHKSTAKLLIKIDQKYRPPQRQSVFELMKKLKQLSDIFLKCLGNQQESMKSSSDSLVDHKGQDVAKAIQSSYISVQQSLMEYKLVDSGQQTITDSLSLPLPQAYIALLKDLRFDYMKLNKTNGKYVHFYESQAQQEQTSPPSKMIRLAQQLADLSTALPIDHTNAIFVRVDRERIDLMKAIIFGANDTPYAHGAFEYDLYLPQKYPEVCPKCNLTTTGSGQVRFNPNLYSSGKVCLSLLGTWRGNANQNWDPKVSTILQVLLSIQAVVMSQQVYFNEPGYENTAGTPQGEKKNEGYSNIVKYSNIKYAMIEQIKNPPKGFQSVVRRHFYLKRQQILDQVKGWIPLAEKNQANYTGLVSSHNWKWCELFKKQRLTFKEKLVQVIEQLETELKKISPPSIRDVGSSTTGGEKKGEQKARVDLKKQAQSLENIDVDDQDQATAKAAAKEMDISDEKVKDRWSRYIGAMGVDAVAKQAAARVLVSGAGAVGIEISKNLVLAGCKSFILHDNKLAKWSDLSGQFFLSHKDINKNRATASVNKLQQLNFYVKVNAMIEDIDETCVKNLDVVIITDPDSIEQVIEINNWCRKYGAKFILAETFGLFARVFDDFGDQFQVLDKNGEELQEVMIKEIKQVEIEEKVKKEDVKIQEHPDEVKKQGQENKAEDDEWVTIKRQKCQVQLLEGIRHNFEDGDLVVISQVQGMNLKAPTKKQTSVNGSKFKVKVVSPSKFTLEDLNMSVYTPYENNGICKQLKQPVTIKFKTFEKAALDKQPAYDMNLIISDFQKMAHWDIMHIGMMNLIKWKSEQNGGLPPMNVNQAKEFIKSSLQMIKESGKEVDQDTCNKVITAIALTARGVFNPISSFIGGMVAQECIKAITGKFSPLNQLFYFNAMELLPELPKKKEEEDKEQGDKKVEEDDDDVKDKEKQAEESKQSNKDQSNKQMEKNDKQSDKKQDQKSIDYLEYWTESQRLPFNHKNQQKRDCGLTSSIGIQLTQKLAKMKLFMVGAGAIGCQLLKNYAMLGLGASDEGLIVLTDPDVIQVSNLNRQFLFREKHLRKPKASTAAAAAIAMNPQLKGRIFARLDKVFPGTEHIFTDKFFKELSIVTNALDNIQARRYVDNRCVTARTPLLESGTLGPKGHVQVILPGKTESYGSQQDPQNQNDIPICTLKMFPQQTVHCVQWARDQFGKLFTQNPQSLNRVLEPDFLQGGGPKDSADLTALHKAVKMLKKMPRTWNDCVHISRLKFQKYFVNDIRQLLYTYPLDKMTKDGKPFWSSPKRPPFEMIFDKGDPLHQTFMVACATLTAKIYGIPAPKNLRKDWQSKANLALASSQMKVPDFKPDKRKAEAIAKEVENEQQKKKGDKTEEEDEEPQSVQADMDVGLLIQQLKELKQKLPKNVNLSEEEKKQKDVINFQAFPQQFEKDNDQNCHIDFIYSLANCRSRNYKLQEMSWINVKLKAGRIVPALATTTAAVSGLQTLELVKIARNCTMEDHRNVFLNLALPSMTASEPGPAQVVQLVKDLKVTLWDRWDVKLGPDVTLLEMLKYLEETYNLQALDVMKGNTPIFFHAIMNAPGKQNEKKAMLEKKMRELLSIDIEAEQEDDKEQENGVYRDITVTFRKRKGEKETSDQEGGIEAVEMKVLKGVPPVRIFFDKVVQSNQQGNKSE